jgi:hypothetical protein
MFPIIVNVPIPLSSLKLSYQVKKQSVSYEYSKKVEVLSI